MPRSQLTGIAVAAILIPTTAAQSPAFDVASLKPVQSTDDLYTANLGTARHGQVALTNATLSDCLRYAFGITNDAQIAGPDWIRNKGVRFDIVGKASPETPVSELLLMLRTLLTERFKMVLHQESRELAFVALTIGKNGPKLKVAGHDAPSAGKPQIPGRIVSSRMSMTTLTTLLSRFMRQTVLDQTGLSGSYEINLVWTPENLHPVATTFEAPDPAPGPSIFTAVQEQLGLKLESRKGPVEVLVIDHAERVPVEN
jgi:uncharacterized protein (TIGR03435 family)